MKLLEAGRFVVGSVAVFVAVATCSSIGDSLGGGGAGGFLARSSGSKGSGGHGGGLVKDANADEAGTRLKPNFVEGADGSRHYLGTFYDTQRAENCTFSPLGDGSFACLPIDSPGVPETGITFFDDDACTHEVVAVNLSAGACPRPLAARYSFTFSGSCATTIRSVKTASCYYLPGGPGSTCTLYGSAGSCTIEDQDVPLSAFVSGTQSH